MTASELKILIQKAIESANEQTWLTDEEGREYEGDYFDQDRAVENVMKVLIENNLIKE